MNVPPPNQHNHSVAPLRSSALPITYDKQGRMQYHPDFHAKQKLPWTTVDQAYLIDHYDSLGPEQVSLDLERTIATIMRRVCDLRKRGQMTKPAKKVHHKRTITSASWMMKAQRKGATHKDAAGRAQAQ